MFCPKCGKINPDNEEKCTGCGAVLHEETEAKVPVKKGKGLKIALAVIAFLIIICIVIFMLNGCAGATLPEEGMSF